MWSFLIAAALGQSLPVTAVHRSEVEVVTPIPPAFPEPVEARVRCLAQVQIDGEGVPTEVSVDEACVEPHATAVITAVRQGRWKVREDQRAPLWFVVPVEGRPGIPSLSMTMRAHPGAEPTPDLKSKAGVQCTVRIGITDTGAVDGASVIGECPEDVGARLIAIVARWDVAPLRVDEGDVSAVGDVRFAVTDADEVFYRMDKLEVMRRVMPAYPRRARRTYARGSTVNCQVRIFVDVAGAPREVRFESCPEVLRGSAERAVTKWRWYPPTLDGEPVEAEFLLNIKYRQE